MRQNEIICLHWILRTLKSLMQTSKKILPDKLCVWKKDVWLRALKKKLAVAEKLVCKNTVELKILTFLEKLGVLRFRSMDHQIYFTGRFFFGIIKSSWGFQALMQEIKAPRTENYGFECRKAWKLTALFVGFRQSRHWCEDRQSENAINFVIRRRSFPLRFWWKELNPQILRNVCLKLERNEIYQYFLDILNN